MNVRKEASKQSRRKERQKRKSESEKIGMGGMGKRESDKRLEKKI